MTPFTCKMLLKFMGWTMYGDIPQEKKCIILAAPHTTIWDFGIGYFYYRAHHSHIRVMVKQESFFFPAKYILRGMGGFPVNRESPQTLLVSIVRRMRRNDDEQFHLVICPEGTRKAVRKWKKGYHTIAHAAGVPVYVAVIDWGTKRVGIHQRLELTDDADADTARLQKIYRDLGVRGKFPECFVTE